MPARRSRRIRRHARVSAGSGNVAMDCGNTSARAEFTANLSCGRAAAVQVYHAIMTEPLPSHISSAQTHSGERIIGHGIDLVSVARFERLLTGHRERFLERTFTRAEQAECARKHRESERLASRFAAKEAALKALGAGIIEGIPLTDIGIVTAATGAPTLVVIGVAKVRADALGITRWLVSLTDTGEWSMASVIAVGSLVA
ncbi:hypothetical protein BH11PLA1_BH11PLA1_10990 [soil metagenome]